MSGNLLKATQLAMTLPVLPGPAFSLRFHLTTSVEAPRARDKYLLSEGCSVSSDSQDCPSPCTGRSLQSWWALCVPTEVVGDRYDEVCFGGQAGLLVTFSQVAQGTRSPLWGPGPTCCLCDLVWKRRWVGGWKHITENVDLPTPVRCSCFRHEVQAWSFL